MIDIQRDSPVPVHEQITSQIMAHVAAGDLPAGTRLADYRRFAQELLANPQVVAKAYGDLEWEGVLRKHADGGMEVIAGADVICRVKLLDAARQRLREAARHGRAVGLSEAEIHQAVDQALTAAPVPTLSAAELSTAIKKSNSPHASSHRDSRGIQDLSRKTGGGSP